MPWWLLNKENCRHAIVFPPRLSRQVNHPLLKIVSSVFLCEFGTIDNGLFTLHLKKINEGLTLSPFDLDLLAGYAGSLRDTHWQGKLLELFNSLRKLSKEFPQSSSLSFNPKLYAAAKEKSSSRQEGNGEKKVWGTLSYRFLCPSATSIITLIANMFLVKKWAMNESLCSRELQLPQSKWGFSTTLLYFTPNREEDTKGGSKSLFKIFRHLRAL